MKYRFQSAPDKIYDFEPSDKDTVLKWEDLRYELEQKLHVHDDAYLDAYYEDDIARKLLSSSEIVDSNKTLVLKRMPLNGQLPFVPLRYQYQYSILPNPPPTENESIDDFVKKSTDTFKEFMRSKPKFKRAHEHASDALKRTKPPVMYTCYCCGEMGAHFRKDCPYNDKPDFIPLIRRGTPKGIPKSKLKLATTDAEKGRAYIDDKGQYVLWKI